MITAIFVRLIVEFKDELSGFIDLYSTLFGNVKIYRINYWLTGMLGSLEFYFSFYLIDLFDKVLWKFMCVEIPIITIGMFFGGYLVEHKEIIKNWIRKKKISKTMTQKWKEKKDASAKKDIQTNEGVQKQRTSSSNDSLSSKLPLHELWDETNEFGDKHR